METGIDYPTLELGGVKYTLRFTRGAFAYHLSKRNLDMGDLRNSLKVVGTLTDILMFVMQPPYLGTPEDLAELLIEEKKMAEANVAIHKAVGKVFPTPVIPAAAAAGDGKPQVQ